MIVDILVKIANNLPAPDAARLFMTASNTADHATKLTRTYVNMSHRVDKSFHRASMADDWPWVWYLEPRVNTYIALRYAIERGLHELIKRYWRPLEKMEYSYVYYAGISGDISLIRYFYRGAIIRLLRRTMQFDDGYPFGDSVTFRTAIDLLGSNTLTGLHLYEDITSPSEHDSVIISAHTTCHIYANAIIGAIHGRHYDLAKRLSKAVHIIDKNEACLVNLQRACECDNLEIVQYLVQEFGTRVLSLYYAVLGGHMSMIEYVRKNDATDADRNIISAAVNSGKIDVVDYVLTHIQPRPAWDIVFTHAVRSDNIDMVKHIVAKMAHNELRYSIIYNSLYDVGYNNNKEMIDYLLGLRITGWRQIAYGAACSNYSIEAFEYAMASGGVDIVDIINGLISKSDSFRMLKYILSTRDLREHYATFRAKARLRPEYLPLFSG